MEKKDKNHDKNGILEVLKFLLLGSKINLCNLWLKKKKAMKISIIGSGFVGTALGKGLIELGNEMIFYEVVDKNLPNFTFAKDINHAIESSNISFICVPTPITKAKELLGWKPKVELKEGLSKMIKWFKEKGNGE